ncbi:hypothetical protein HZP84_04080 [Elizabethkingia anophelis]|nr:hypothetical protein [Elizabethkingia anophelis]
MSEKQLDYKSRVFALQNLAMRLYLQICIEESRVPDPEIFKAITINHIPTLIQVIKIFKDT